MAWHQSGDKPLSEPMMVNLLTHICVTRPWWVNQTDVDLLSVGPLGANSGSKYNNFCTRKLILSKCCLQYNFNAFSDISVEKCGNILQWCTKLFHYLSNLIFSHWIYQICVEAKHGKNYLFFHWILNTDLWTLISCDMISNKMMGSIICIIIHCHC